MRQIIEPLDFYQADFEIVRHEDEGEYWAQLNSAARQEGVYAGLMYNFYDQCQATNFCISLLKYYVNWYSPLRLLYGR